MEILGPNLESLVVWVGEETRRFIGVQNGGGFLRKNLQPTGIMLVHIMARHLTLPKVNKVPIRSSRKQMVDMNEPKSESRGHRGSDKNCDHKGLLDALVVCTASIPSPVTWTRCPSSLIMIHTYIHIHTCMHTLCAC